MIFPPVLCVLLCCGDLNKLRKVRWVLFDQNTYEVYHKEIERQFVTDIVNSSELDRINRILRNSGV